MNMNKSLLIPLGVVLTLVVILALGFGLDDPHKLPSEMIDREFPAFELAGLEDETVTKVKSNLPGEITLVNVWATWCANCLVEHPELMRIAEEEEIPIVGVNYNDDRAKALTWLERHGSPYQFSVYDNEGKLAIDLGVYGAPETFVLDANGVIRFRYVGPVTPRIWAGKLKPVIDHLRTGDA